MPTALPNVRYWGQSGHKRGKAHIDQPLLIKLDL
jgi:hypothetical protein